MIARPPGPVRAGETSLSAAEDFLPVLSPRTLGPCNSNLTRRRRWTAISFGGRPDEDRTSKARGLRWRNALRHISSRSLPHTAHLEVVYGRRGRPVGAVGAVGAT